MTCASPCQTLHKPRDLVTDAPCRTTWTRRPKPTWPSGTKSPSDSGKPSPPSFRPEAPSTDESPRPRSVLVPGTRASWPPLIPRFCHLGSASDTLSRAGKRARPLLRTGFRRSSRATCRSSTSAIVWTHKHNLVLARPRRNTAVLPPRGGQRRLRRAVTSWVVTVQGSRRRFAPSPPPRRPPASTWIYPKPIGPDTLCRSQMLPARRKKCACNDWPETSPSDDSFRNPWRISSPDSPHLP